jgi:hypothetical protein
VGSAKQKKLNRWRKAEKDGTSEKRKHISLVIDNL